MIIPDVNVLVYAAREDAPRHAEYRRWLTDVLGSLRPLALPDVVLSGFLRVVTHPRVFASPTPIARAIEFLDVLRSHPSALLVQAGERHWPIFTELCRSAEAKGNLVPDAYLAALAVEHGAELVSSDRDFARFPGLRWRHPLPPA